MSRETLGLLLGFVGVVIFGGSLPFTQLTVAALDPWFVSAARAALAGCVAGAVLLAVRPARPAPRDLAALLLSALCLVGGFPTLTALAVQTVPVSHGGVVLGILPLATAAASALLTGERPRPAFWAAAVAGAALVIGFALRDGGGRVEPGDALLLVAVAVCAVGYVLSGRLTRRIPGWAVISWMLVLSAPVSVPLAFLLAPSDLGTVPASAWIGLAYITLLSQYLGFFAWNAGLALGGIARVSQVQLLQTFVTLGIAALLNGERVDGPTWGVAVAVVGLVLFGRRAAVQPARAEVPHRSEKACASRDFT